MGVHYTAVGINDGPSEALSICTLVIGDWIVREVPQEILTMIVVFFDSGYSIRSEACTLCNHSVLFGAMQDHLNNVCQRYSIACALCGASVMHCEMSKHWKNECSGYDVCSHA